MRTLPLLLVALAAAAAAQPAPASDYADLLDTRFYPNTGQFLFDSPGAEFILFPGREPSYEIENSAYIVRDAADEVVGGRRIGSTGTTGSSAIQTLGMSGAPEWPRALEAGGAYSLDLIWQGQIVGRVPFTVSLAQSDDPYDPGQSIVLDGPWRTHAYFSHQSEKPEYLMHFHAWIADDEVPGGGATEVSVRRGGEEVAWGHGWVDTQYGWGMAEYRLYPAGTRKRFGNAEANAGSWTIQDVTPGPYEVVLQTEAGPFRTMTIEGGADGFVPHARSAVDFEPRAYFLTTRRMSNQMLNVPNTLYWIAPDVE